MTARNVLAAVCYVAIAAGVVGTVVGAWVGGASW